ncbi:MAG: aspartate--tRNA ligase [Firmicutes bacterium]|nr:aspartate--tRNA ligase [Bacillota bacterium]
MAEAMNPGMPKEWHRSRWCGQLRAEDAGQPVVLNGWVNRRRDHGGLIFLDLRDRTGIVQVVLNPEISRDAYEAGQALRPEYVVGVRGRVQRRPAGTENAELATGQVEVQATDLLIFNASKTPPFAVAENQAGPQVDETVRLRYRYLDLRRPSMYQILELRHRVVKAVRDYFDAHGFLEVETPMLTRSTPEGARDYLVPSRLHPGAFYALPQSPQLFKQLLMVGGIERYFQIARCFRDEDLRADRQPEFTQVDLEMSFVDAQDVQDVVEDMMVTVFHRVLGVEIPRPIPRLTWADAMARFGTDKPDLRFGLELVDVSGLVAQTQFQVFRQALEKGGQVKGIQAPGCARFTRKEIDALTQEIAVFGAKGLAWIAIQPDGQRHSPIARFFSEGELQALQGALQAGPGDLMLFVAGPPTVVAQSLGYLRNRLGHQLGLVEPGAYRFAWVVDFPMFTYDEEEKRLVAEHHPFTSPKDEDLPLLDSAPEKVRAKSYDLVLNGFELGSGSIRIHRREVQERIFRAMGFSPQEAGEKFGFLLEAFEYGTPPHGGMALGVDRIIMLMSGRDNVRDVIAFPKTQSATDLLMEAPSEVSPRQLQDLHIRVALAPQAAVAGK